MSIKVTIEPFIFSDINHLAERWLQLEESAESSIFLSWHWIKHWLAMVTYPMFLVEATFEGQVVGLGVFSERKRFSLGIVPVTQWWLHRTGDQAQDQIWMEYNDFLLTKENKGIIRSAMIKHLSEQYGRYDECIIGLSTPEVLSAYKAHFFHAKEVVNDKGYLIDFSAVKENYSASCLSRNTRQQLNRTERLLTEQGELTLHVVKDLTEKKDHIQDIKNLHIARWENSGTPSGFINPIFDRFFTQVYFNSCTELICISVDHINVAFLVNFIYQGKVYFYLSSLEQYKDKKIKLGMLAHKKAVEHYLKRGMVSYDFLAGDSQYKMSLSNQHYSHNMLCFYRSSILLSFERKIKKIVVQLLNLVKKIGC